MTDAEIERPLSDDEMLALIQDPENKKVVVGIYIAGDWPQPRSPLGARKTPLRTFDRQSDGWYEDKR